MNRVLDDLRRTERKSVYVAARLPRLPFADDTFELAVCSHLLFLYSAELSAEFHLVALRELLRVAGEVQVFPLLDMRENHRPTWIRL